MSNDEIKNSTPLLDQLKKKKSGFSIPEDYFENIESSILLNTKKSDWASNPFKVPQNYFEDIDSNSICSNKRKEIKFHIYIKSFLDSGFNCSHADFKY
jgi:hypothetical protein